ncbi:hypothetical protein [Polynucleobacter ibericus]|uniref:hypothetical protein n=1 Tax=Polynucleobacter ibericus TaxID=1819725 RepID=UPI001BFD06D9|nr:hypothetical protein [Polynucleobacter ibericus]QWE08103.1 hypothetical protein AOC20_06630 [Polynucleobacter ibericus]
MTEESAQTISPNMEEIKKDQPKTLTESDGSTEPENRHSRRAGLSKREIMEQLSRERFPWDE